VVIVLAASASPSSVASATAVMAAVSPTTKLPTLCCGGQ
jgi:hypothetical protein